MKLWVKVSVIVIIVLLLVVGLNTFFTLQQARSSILRLAMDNAQELHGIAEQQLQQGSVAHRQQVDSEIARRSMLQYYAMHRLRNPNAVLHGEKVLYSSITPELPRGLELTPIIENGGTDIRMNEETILIGNEMLLFNGESFTLYTAHDIRPVGEAMRDTTIRLIILCTGCVLLGACLVVWLMRRATRPLSDLAHSAHRFANGQYNERIITSSEDEVGQLTKNFNAMAEAVEQTISELTVAAQRQALFIGSMSHEMKTPITAIIGHAETLLFTEMPDSVREDALAQILTQSRWLENLSKKLLQMIVAEQPISCKQIAIPDLLEAVEEATREGMEARGVRLETSFSVDVMHIDMDLMVSAITNLVENAAKASQTGQCVRLQVSAGEISVTDSGIGIPPEHLHNVMEPFYMADPSRNKKTGGFGLGLSIAQHIAKAHNARLTIESIPEQGTCVRILFDINI